jgi:hypothetical protein
LRAQGSRPQVKATLCRLANIVAAIQAGQALVDANQTVIAHWYRFGDEVVSVLKKILEWSKELSLLETRSALILPVLIAHPSVMGC